VPGLIVGYFGGALSDVYRVADLVATRLASKHLGNVRTSAFIVKVMQTKRTCRAWGHPFARGFSWGLLDRVLDNPDPAPGSRKGGSELDSSAEFSFFYLPPAGESRS
jgi:hypothetical protein